MQYLPTTTSPQSEPAGGSRAVPRFLSPSWVEEFNSALEGVVLPGAGPDAGLVAADGRFTVVQEVHGAPDGDLRVILHVDAGTATPYTGGYAAFVAQRADRIAPQRLFSPTGAT